MDKINLGLFIKKRRQQLKITQKDLADFFNVSIQAIYKWENGSSYPDFVILGELVTILKISIDDLLNLNIPNSEYNETRKFNYQTFGKTIEKYQKYYKLTQKDLANKTSLNQAAISNIINGKAYPSINQFIILANFFKISYSDLYFSIFNEKKTKAIHLNLYKKYFILVMTIVIILSIIGIIININNDSSNNNSKRPSFNTSSPILNKPKDVYYIEYWDEHDNLIGNEIVEHNKPLLWYPDCPTSLGWNKSLSLATTSTIYKANKNPYELILNVFFGNTSNLYYYDSIADFNIIGITNDINYCKELTYQNGDIFDVNNITKGEYELYAKYAKIQTHSISFPSNLNIKPVFINDGEMINFELPVICNNDYFIKGYKYDNKEIKHGDIYSFEKSINLEPIYHNQTTMINNDGLITYLSSYEKEIIIPDTINNIKVKGIDSKAITLNPLNNKIVFQNKEEIVFNDIISNPSSLENINEIEILENGFFISSSIGDLKNISRCYIKNNQMSIAPYNLTSISTNNNFHINSLEYSSPHGYRNFNFANLNVDEVYFLDDFAVDIFDNMFGNSTLKNIYFTNKMLANNNSTYLRDSAFRNCKNLEKFDFPNSTVIIGDKQFENCTNLQNVTFYGNISCLSNYMFSNTKIENIVINYTVNNIEMEAFINTNLKNIQIVNPLKLEKFCYIPETITDLYIGNYYNSPLNLNNPNNLTIHFLDHNISSYQALNTSKYKACLDCLHLHKGEY